MVSVTYNYKTKINIKIQEIKINNNSSIVVLRELSQEHSTESRNCIYELGANQNQQNEDADNNMNIKLAEKHQEDNGYTLADTTDSNNDNSSENEEEFLEHLRVELNGTTCAETSSHTKKHQMTIDSRNQAESWKAAENQAFPLQTIESVEGKEDEEELAEDDIAIYIENESIDKALRLTQET